MDKECVNFNLKTTQINSSPTFADYLNTTVTTTKGQISNNFSSFTWYNVNIRMILGDLYDKYDRFNICLNNISVGPQGGGVQTADNRLLHIKLSGMPFTTSYNQGTTSNIGQIILNTVNLPLPAATISTYYYAFSEKPYFTFYKNNSSTCNLTIDLQKVSNDDYPNVTFSTQLLGHLNFAFSIYGVEDYRIDNNKHTLYNHN